ncbi:polyprenyl diphosphate synthase [Idiomarina aminovorans]|uniref:polyprenyl diphosphate synthase n=1 Tax=Idiomarina aminovorans TaxID=2914829 RepID=UPI002003778C|nr:polyprenyl diphosphate synthase [Idiomarina sp. ATCH4]MCK7460107.1 polyprenyl diphosphate synthase [Idiomarina sp. ATCH4]
MKELPSIEQLVPKHVAIIMDGNGRWAKQRGKIRTSGHKAGAEAVRKAVAFARRNGIESLTLFAFSSENWKRPAKEISVLMELFMSVLKSEIKKLDDNHICLRIIGDKGAFSKRLQRQMNEAEQQTRSNSGLNLNIAANYGGQWDITQASRKLAEKVKANEIDPAEITEQAIAGELMMADQPLPDLLIRTGGEHRISNFLLWQLAYAELYFTSVLWPNFDDTVFARAITDFAQRERRFGLTSEQLTVLMQDIETRIEE